MFIDTEARNSVGCDCVYIHKYNRLYAFARTLYEDYQNPSDQETVVKLIF